MSTFHTNEHRIIMKWNDREIELDWQSVWI